MSFAALFDQVWQLLLAAKEDLKEIDYSDSGAISAMDDKLVRLISTLDKMKAWDISSESFSRIRADTEEIRSLLCRENGGFRRSISYGGVRWTAIAQHLEKSYDLLVTEIGDYLQKPEGK